MIVKYIPLFLLSLWLASAQANAADLSNMTNALENLADMSRSADEANEALHNALTGKPSRYSRYHDRGYRYYDRGYHRYYDDYDYEAEKEYRRHLKKMEKARVKAMRRHEREWRKRHRHDMYRPSYHGERRLGAPPMFFGGIPFPGGW